MEHTINIIDFTEDSKWHWDCPLCNAINEIYEEPAFLVFVRCKHCKTTLKIK